MINKSILIGTLFLFGVVNMTAQELNEAQKQRQRELTFEFISHREYTKEIINNHLLTHPDCDIKLIAPAVDQFVFLFGWNFPDITAWCFPDQYNRKIFFNVVTKWDKKKAARDTIHEAFHLVKICQPDSVRSSTPVCRLFGELQYDSAQINNVIMRHLKKDFENESIASSK